MRFNFVKRRSVNNCFSKQKVTQLSLVEQKVSEDLKVVKNLTIFVILLKTKSSVKVGLNLLKNRVVRIRVN